MENQSRWAIVVLICFAFSAAGRSDPDGLALAEDEGNRYAFRQEGDPYGKLIGAAERSFSLGRNMLCR